MVNLDNIDVLAIGPGYLDINFVDFPIEKINATGSQTIGSKYSYYPGGSTVIFAQVLSNLQRHTQLISSVGNDDFGKIFQSRLVNEYLSLTPLTQDGQTQISVTYSDGQGGDVLTSAGQANQLVEPSQVLDQLKATNNSAKWLYLGGCFRWTQFSSSYIEIINLAKSKGMKVCLDHGRVSSNVTTAQINQMKACINQVDLYCPSRQEFQTLWPGETLQKSMQAFAMQYPQTQLVVTAGTQGVMYLDNNKMLMVPRIKTKQVNTVGAGDSFNAGVIFGLLTLQPMPVAIHWGLAAAAAKVMSADLPSLESIKTIFQDNYDH